MGTLVIDSRSAETAGALEPTGDVTIDADATLRFELDGTDTYTGTWTSNGQLQLAGEEEASQLDLTGADANISSTLSIDIAGTFANQFSAFEGINKATLGGADLEITLDGFTPAPGDTFEILDSVTLSGLLGNVANGATLSTSGGEGTFVVNYGAGSAFESNSVVLSGFTLSGGTLGDFDGDGAVGGGDGRGCGQTASARSGDLGATCGQG